MTHRPIAITDTTLRDGDHAMSHQFTLAQIRSVAAALDAAGVPVIEVCHGDGLAGSSFQYGFSREAEDAIIATAAEVIHRGRLAVLLLPGIATRRDLLRAARLGARIARVATHCTEADISEQHIKAAKDLSLDVHSFLMMAHMIEPERLAAQAALMASYGADCVYVVDSAGAMLEREARARVRALRAALPPAVEIGFHAHNNLGIAVSNSLAAIEEGASRIDGSTCGLGAGAGNTQTEALVAVLAKLGIPTGVDLFQLMDVAEEVVLPMMLHKPRIDRSSLAIGYAGVYSTFLLHAHRAAARFGVEARDILLELGRRKAVGGQEDMIIDVAVALAARKDAATDEARGRVDGQAPVAG
jgi:4-hydroxy-2-oxovalerate aldolase